MLEPIRHLSVEVVPQAVLNLPVAQVVKKFARVHSGHDDLDTFEGASFKLDNKIEISVRHYSGHPENTSTIYIDRSINGLDSITKLIRQILNELDVMERYLTWERRDDPDL
ncbi:MAG: hypothetical protein P4M07_08735 [Xanthobacteraceae bacterium]|nr:hypothetical protein [Xanthobacteraceae bacterium]